MRTALFNFLFALKKNLLKKKNVYKGVVDNAPSATFSNNLCHFSLYRIPIRVPVNQR
jgi:hypothetical protein